MPEDYNSEPDIEVDITGNKLPLKPAQDHSVNALLDSEVQTSFFLTQRGEDTIGSKNTVYGVMIGSVGLHYSGLAYFTDVGHYLVWVYLSYDRETYIKVLINLLAEWYNLFPSISITRVVIACMQSTLIQLLSLFATTLPAGYNHITELVIKYSNRQLLAWR